MYKSLYLAFYCLMSTYTNIRFTRVIFYELGRFFVDRYVDRMGIFRV